MESYRAGAAVERTFDLPATYNRANTIKLGLQAGAFTLDEAQAQLRELREVLERKLAADERAADDAWLWADLADCRLLLGDVEQATEAYLIFVQMVRSSRRRRRSTFSASWRRRYANVAIVVRRRCPREWPGSRAPSKRIDAQGPARTRGIFLLIV